MDQHAIGVDAVSDRVARLSDPKAVAEHGFGKGRSPGQALYRCLLAITGFPFQGQGLHTEIARYFGISGSALGVVRSGGGLRTVEPFLRKLGLALVVVGDDVIVCHPNRFTFACDPVNPRGMP